MSAIQVPLRRPVTARDPHEDGRVATPLELFFDLVFVVAIASAGAQLHHGLTEAHVDAFVGYSLTFVAIWWAWVSYTWYASAYDNDDVVFRLLTLLIMAGALLLAAGVPQLFETGQSVIVVAGYVLMRLAMVGLWLRAARGHPERRQTALTYAVGITAVQGYWVLRLAIHDGTWIVPSFLLGMGLELLVPWVAERRHGITPFHPHHIAERYGLLTIIVLGEVILSTVQALQGAIAANELGGELAAFVVGGLLLVFSMWWLYFKADHVEMVEDDRTVFLFGYGHLLVFASAAAVGACLAAGVDVALGEAEVSDRTVALTLAVAVSVFAVGMSGLHAVSARNAAVLVPSVVVAACVVAVGLLGPPIGLAVLLDGLILATAVAQHVVETNRRAPVEDVVR